MPRMLGQIIAGQGVKKTLPNLNRPAGMTVPRPSPGNHAQNMAAIQALGSNKPTGGGDGFWNTVAGLGESIYGQQLAGQNVEQLEQQWKDQVSAARPGSTTGLAYGDAVYDEATNTLQYAPSGAAQGMLSSLYGQQAGFADKLSNLDPYSLGQQMYDLKRPAMLLEQDRQTAQLLERLKAGGMLSSSHGGQLQGGLAQAQYMANQQALSEDIMNAQNISSAVSTQQQQNAAIIDAINTGQLNQLSQNIGMGVNVAPPESLSTAYTNQMDTKAKKGSSLGNILGIAGNALFPGLSGLFS